MIDLNESFDVGNKIYVKLNNSNNIFKYLNKIKDKKS